MNQNNQTYNQNNQMNNQNNQINNQNNQNACNVHPIHTSIGGRGGRRPPRPLYWYISDVLCMHFDCVDYLFDYCDYLFDNFNDICDYFDLC